MNNLNILIAFVGGLASFISPCVLPLVPAYIAQLVGPSVAEGLFVAGKVPAARVASGGEVSARQVVAAAPVAGWRTFSRAERRLPLWHAIAFVAGFGLTFIALGATASVLGYFLKAHQLLIARVGGLALIILGLHFAGVFTIPWLQREGRIQWRPAQRSFPASVLVGIVFALGWTPCIGVVLTPILLLAEQSATLASGVVLLSAYTLGLGVPFLVLGAAFWRAAPLLRRLTPHLGTIERVTGIIIAVMGFFIFNGWLIWLNQYFNFTSGY